MGCLLIEYAFKFKYALLFFMLEICFERFAIGFKGIVCPNIPITCSVEHKRKNLSNVLAAFFLAVTIY